eukprot:TRINITY_DN6617_c0_g1_i1.p1 TRINITY_DN6617_c0_g1~~TRINITY_DN6617_c0_g1_i1.p1  ORF type:complete len:569 (+),score=135.53 TRINITY_DN6617_c0_g1_i1:99-1805(+)
MANNNNQQEARRQAGRDRASNHIISTRQLDVASGQNEMLLIMSNLRSTDGVPLESFRTSLRELRRLIVASIVQAALNLFHLLVSVVGFLWNGAFLTLIDANGESHIWQLCKTLVHYVVSFFVLSFDYVVFEIVYILQYLFDRLFWEYLSNITVQVSGPENPFSNVNNASPRLLTQDLPKLIQDSTIQDFDDLQYKVSNSKLFLLYSALAYENVATTRSVLPQEEKKDDEVKFWVDSDKRSKFSIFYSKQKKVVVITFKGTSPFRWDEWSQDATIVLRSTNNFPGLVHRGFYDRIFEDGGGRVLIDLETKLKEVYEAAGDDAGNVRIWITGHSLGAAMCSVFTAYVVSNLSLDENWNFGGFSRSNFKGSYSYGTPRVGDLEFARYIQQAAELIEYPFYRVIGSTDIVCRIPFGISLTSGHNFSNDLFGTYCHFGTAVNLYSGVGETITHLSKDPCEWEILVQFWNYFTNLGWLLGRRIEDENVLGYLRRFLNPLVNALDHLPSEYYWRINEADIEAPFLFRLFWKLTTSYLHLTATFPSSFLRVIHGFVVVIRSFIGIFVSRPVAPRRR